MPKLKFERFEPIGRQDYEVQGEDPIKTKALQAYIYGFPLVLGDITRRNGYQALAQYNKFLNQKLLSTPEVDLVVRPNVDTLYSISWLDLSDGPLILSVPDTNGRYYLMEMLDAWSNVFASIGSRTTGTQAGEFLIVGPNCDVKHVPKNMIKISAPTNTVWIIGRTQTNGPEDYPIVYALQAQYTLTPLNKYAYANVTKLLNEGIIVSKDSPKTQIETMDAPTFFTIMMKEMCKNPPYPQIQTPEITKTLLDLGLIPSENFNFYCLKPYVQEALIYAVQNGISIIQAATIKIFEKDVYNNWIMPLKDIGTYGTLYTIRAVIALNFYGANLPQDSVYGYAFLDIDSNPLIGINNYVVHFDADKLPPVNAFWSITLYGADGYLVANPINRYAISPHLGKLTYNADGSLDIFIQNTAPTDESFVSNWLPTPIGSFNLVLRLYWPQSPILNGQWVPPGIMKQD